MSQESSAHMSRISEIIVGGVMIAAAFLTVLGMSHHPTSATQADTARVTHAVLISLQGVIFLGYIIFAVRRGAGKGFVAAGLVAFLFNLMAVFGAANVSGFIIPALNESSSLTTETFALLRAVNQTLSVWGVFATSLAILFWAVSFVLTSGTGNRIVGLIGLALSAVPALLLASGLVVMDVHGATLVYASHAAFAAIVGMRLMQGKI
ncbi:hypothetical protein PUV54_07745 [Hyphococcus flavus]|uniref:DUF4386 family protein n=1 Tax=Hyphococcus flavus TaxID=1866326 RepID=A0AAF0CIP9_9PROT|nr:hypothetical protein [Hyphococcus flavus]WDI33087.1 hypothetical protein PUV54_07745 [Hyphococcus flavus]